MATPTMLPMTRREKNWGTSLKAIIVDSTAKPVDIADVSLGFAMGSLCLVTAARSVPQSRNEVSAAWIEECFVIHCL